MILSTEWKKNQRNEKLEVVKFHSKNIKYIIITSLISFYVCKFSRFIIQNYLDLSQMHQIMMVELILCNFCYSCSEQKICRCKFVLSSCILWSLNCQNRDNHELLSHIWLDLDETFSGNYHVIPCFDTSIISYIVQEILYKKIVCTMFYLIGFFKEDIWLS